MAKGRPAPGAALRSRGGREGSWGREGWVGMEGERKERSKANSHAPLIFPSMPTVLLTVNYYPTPPLPPHPSSERRRSALSHRLSLCPRSLSDPFHAPRSALCPRKPRLSSIYQAGMSRSSSPAPRSPGLVSHVPSCAIHIPHLSSRKGIPHRGNHHGRLLLSHKPRQGRDISRLPPAQRRRTGSFANYGLMVPPLTPYRQNGFS